VLWAEGANDVIADKLQIPLYTVTWIARVMVFVGPVVAFIVTRRICLGLQRKDRDLLEHGLETGIIRQLPHGEFIEVHRPLTEEERAPLEAKKVPALLPGPGSADENGLPAPQGRGVLGRARVIANRGFAETIVVEADGHGNGHGPAEEHAVGAGPADAEEQAEIGPGELPESSVPHTDPLLWHPHQEPPDES
jgi:ubiquinol-cytochrome c reductase cytochrome b subunit